MGFSVKALFLPGNVIRRFAMQTKSFGALVATLRALGYEKDVLRLSYQDADGDDVAFSSDAELVDALAHVGPDKLLRITVRTAPPAAATAAAPANDQVVVHPGIECDGCQQCPIKGIRYKCAQCADYDLCEACEAAGVHDPTHAMLKMRTPLSLGRVKVLDVVMPHPMTGFSSEAFNAAIDTAVSAATQQVPVAEAEVEAKAAEEDKSTNAATAAADAVSIEAGVQAAVDELIQQTNEAEMPSMQQPAQVAQASLAARFVNDVTIEDGTQLVCGTQFEKAWTVRNDSPTTAWPAGTVLAFVGGDAMGAASSVPVPAAAPGQDVTLRVMMQAPAFPGRYVGFWRMACPDGTKFGHRIWVEVNVTSPHAAPSEVSSVTSYERVARPSTCSEPEEPVEEEVAVAAPVTVPAPAPVPVLPTPVVPEPVHIEESPLTASTPAFVQPQQQQQQQQQQQPVADAESMVFSLRALTDMGFTDTPRLTQMLFKAQGSLEAVLDQLLQ